MLIFESETELHALGFYFATGWTHWFLNGLSLLGTFILSANVFILEKIK